VNGWVMSSGWGSRRVGGVRVEWVGFASQECRERGLARCLLRSSLLPPGLMVQEGRARALSRAPALALSCASPRCPPASVTLRSGL